MTTTPGTPRPSTTTSTTPPAARVSVRTDVVFGQGGGRDLRCDIYTPPPGTANGTALVLLHGGGWSGGDRTQLRGYGFLLGQQGYTSILPEYRLTGEALWPAQIEDVHAAIRYVRANAAALGIDPRRIVVSGNSAGGHLALMAGGTAGEAAFAGTGGNTGVSSAVAAVIAFYPPAGLEARSWGGLPSLVGPGADLETLRGASPLTYAGPAFPPTLFIHGNRDELVPASESVAMYEALDAVDVPVELHLFANQPHGFDADPRLGRQCAALMHSFIERTVPV